jgi:hypothetical protein
MADLGAISLWIALALAAYSTVGSVAGKLRLSPALVESAQSAMYAAGLALMVATLSLVVSFISRDFEIAYVAAHSDLAMANKFTWVAFYAGNEGSLLYIATILSIMSAIAVWRAPEKFKDALPYTTAILMLTLTFFVAVMAVMANPFDKLPFVPLDGDGINPLLTHFGMFFHPPALMAGLIGITVPFAFAIGSLLAGKTGDEWVDAGRVWGMVSWVLLAGGLLLGSWWAYTILGWGGFWFWDPVENAAFMPWLGITAFIHSIMVQKRRGKDLEDDEEDQKRLAAGEIKAPHAEVVEIDDLPSTARTSAIIFLIGVVAIVFFGFFDDLRPPKVWFRDADPMSMTLLIQIIMFTIGVIILIVTKADIGKIKNSQVFQFISNPRIFIAMLTVSKCTPPQGQEPRPTQ